MKDQASKLREMTQDIGIKREDCNLLDACRMAISIFDAEKESCDFYKAHIKYIKKAISLEIQYKELKKRVVSASLDQYRLFGYKPKE